MNDPIIQIRGIGKKYNITHTRGGYIALRDVLTSIAKSPFRFFKQKAKEVTGLAKSEEFWALKDVSLDIQQGDIVGIIGSNGAGKSTLLKILTGITPPTEGEIRMNGRVASLLEVGTGFHPELTGRENIFLNGAILGMTKKEIASKFDEIVAFAGIEKFLDTPVKRYSSGMYVRLAFSVAAHMDPDILLVDEVLAVGDAEFQKKSLGKMEEVTKTAGRTILFVSHNMEAIQRLCNKVVLLEKGRVVMMGATEKAVQRYFQKNTFDNQIKWTGNEGDDHVRMLHTYVKMLDLSNVLHTASPLEIGIRYEVLKPIDNLILGFTLFSEFGYELAYTLYDDGLPNAPEKTQPGMYIRKFTIPENTLAQGTYRIEIDLGIHGIKRIIHNEGMLVFTLENTRGLGRRFPLSGVRGKTSLFRASWSNYSP